MDATIISDKAPESSAPRESAAPEFVQSLSEAADIADAGPAGDSIDLSRKPVPETGGAANVGTDIGSVELPACHIDLQLYTIVSFNTAFCSFFSCWREKERHAYARGVS